MRAIEPADRSRQQARRSRVVRMSRSPPIRARAGALARPAGFGSCAESVAAADGRSPVPATSARRDNRPCSAALCSPPRCMLALRRRRPSRKSPPDRGAAAPRRRPRPGRVGPGAQPPARLRRRHRHRRQAGAGPGAGRARRGSRRRGRRRADQRARGRGRASTSRGSCTTGAPSPAASSSSSGRCRRVRGKAAAAGQERRRGARPHPASWLRPIRRAWSSCRPATAPARTSPSRRSGAPRTSTRRRPGTSPPIAKSPSPPRCAPRGAYAVVERGAWLAQGGAPLTRPRRRRSACWSNRCTRCARFASATRPARSSSPGSPAAAAAPWSPRTAATGAPA